jgi:RNA polymerase sigma-70 factor, ECF subfamily
MDAGTTLAYGRVDPSPWRKGNALVNRATGNKAPPSERELQKWLESVADNGDRQAFANLFSYFAPRVKAYLVRTGLAEEAAEETTQDVMLSVWRKAKLYDCERAGVATWIFAITRNCRVDRYRRDIRVSSAHSDASDEPEYLPTGEDGLIAAERDARVRSALSRLTDEQALVIRLSFFEEKAHARIAGELGIPLGTVKSRVRLAMSHLRKLLGSEQ